ncbi:MAG TPA: DUF6069 family protein [Longimicrobiales bacterium]
MPYLSPVLSKYEQLGNSWSPPLRGAVLATLVNTLIYGLAVAAGVFTSFRFRPLAGGELTIGPILIASLAVPPLAFAAYRTLHGTRGTSYRTFRDSGWFAILASLFLPLTFAAWSFSQVFAAQVMHVVVGIAALYGVSEWANVSAERR